MCFKKSRGIIKKTKFRKVAQITVICRFYCPHTHYITIHCSLHRNAFMRENFVAPLIATIIFGEIEIII